MIKTRDSNLELLRVISIFMVLFIHAFGLISGMGYTEVGKTATILANSVCNIGVTCFILISGYYGINFKLDKLFKMEFMVIFYSILITACTVLFFPEMVIDSFQEQIIKSLIPVISRKYWFYSCYMCLALMSSFINKAIAKAGRKELERLIITAIFLFSIFPTFFYFEITMDNGKGFINMLLIYIIGRWIRLYADFCMDRKKGMGLFVIILGINYFANLFPIHVGPVRHTFNVDNSITNILMAILLLYIFKGLSIKNKWINSIAKHIFAVFILNTFILQIVHNNILKIGPEKVLTNWMPLWIAADVILSFVICILIDLIRGALLGRGERLVCNLLENAADFVWHKFSAFNMSKIRDFLIRKDS